MRFRHELETRASIEHAFAYVADLANSARWDPGVVSSRRATAGPLAVGTEFDLVVRFLGVRVPYRYRIVELDEPRRAVLAGRSKSTSATDTVVFSPAESGSRIEWSAEVELRGLARIVGLVSRPLLDAAGRRALARLKRTLDGSATL